MRRDARSFNLAEALARIPRVQKPPLPLRIWHLRHAIFLCVVAPAGLVSLGAATHPVAPISILISIVVAVVMVPESTRWAVGRMRCVLVPHRIRATFQAARICSPDGRTPTIWWTSPMPRGVRVRIRCPIGMRPGQIEECEDILAAACHADEVLVVSEPGHQTIIVGLRYAPRGRWWDR